MDRNYFYSARGRQLKAQMQAHESVKAFLDYEYMMSIMSHQVFKSRAMRCFPELF
jgi:hypothetical protein